MRPIAYKAPLSDGTIGDRTGYRTAVPGLLVGPRRNPCPWHETTCWRVVHGRSGRSMPFCFGSPEGALEMARRMPALGSWTVDESAALRRMALPVAQRIATQWARELGGWMGGPRETGPLGIDNGVIA